MLMNWTRVRKFFGVEKPYDFRVAIPFICSLFGLTFLGLTFGYSFWIGSVHFGTSRFYFYIYLFFVLTCSVAAVRVSSLAWLLIFAFVLELGFGYSSSFLARKGFGASFYPKDTLVQAEEHSRFSYHPLLMGVPRPNYKSPDGLVIAEHNKQGLRGFEIENNPMKKLVFVYGGSTTYDIGVDQGMTWPEQLQNNLGEDFTVVNFGVPGYTSAEAIIQTSFYQNILGRKPNCSIYYLGWNDIRNAHINDLDPGYADFHLMSQIGNLNVRKPDPEGFWRVSPIALAIVGSLKARLDNLPYPKVTGEISSRADVRLEGIFSENIKTLAYINNGRKVKPVFVGQVLNRAELTGDNRYGWLPYVKDIDVWPLQKNFNDILKRDAIKSGAMYIDVGIDNFRPDDFIDNGHFSAKGSKKFSDLIFDKVKTQCK